MSEFPEFIRDLPQADVPISGVTGRLLQGERNQVVFFSFARDVAVPEHSHGAQWEIVVAGEVRLTLQGEERTYRAGESFFVPAGAQHSAQVRAGFRSIAVFDQADRYRALPA
ncbi:MAG: cupin domain-containing protein [Planctomycetes bacterium]|nr:cupin domain-containing protein [Planctomycetota bacterium]